jgi:predicted alpha/beta hydrolase
MSQGNEPRIDHSLRLPAADGFRLAATLYEPGAVRHGRTGDAVVLINPATAAPRGYYDGFARFLTGRGFSVLTYDYRGIGDSRPGSLRGFKARLRDWGEQDMAGMVDWTARHLQPAKLLVVGHSVGGQIVGLAGNNGKVDALLGVAAQNGYYGHWPAPARFDLALRWHLLVPAVSLLFGYVPGWLGLKEDLPGGVAREWAAWCRRPGFLLDGHEERRHGFERFDRPILAYSFEDDGYAPRPAVQSLLGLYRNARVTHRHVAPGEAGAQAIGHFGFFRDRFRETLWKEAARWLEEQAGLGAAPAPAPVRAEPAEAPAFQVA